MMSSQDKSNMKKTNNWFIAGITFFLIVFGTVLLRNYLKVKQNSKTSIENRQYLLKTSPKVISSSNINQIKFARFLSQKGVVMYGTYKCPYYQSQKELFGNKASKKLNIIECSKDGKNNQFELCSSKNIKGFPSWEINNEIYLGIKTLEEIAELTNYSGATN